MVVNEGVNIIWDESLVEVVVKLCVMNEVGNIIWDLVDVEVVDVICFCDEGLVMEIDYDEMLVVILDGVLVLDDFGDLIILDCFILQIVFLIIVGYCIDMVGDVVLELICVIFDIDVYLGKCVLNKCLLVNMEWVLLCDGVVKDDIYDVLVIEEGQIQVFVKLDIIKDDVIWWIVVVEILQLLVDGEIVMGLIYNGCLFLVIVEQGQLIGMLWDVQMLDFDGWIIFEGLLVDCLEVVMKFVNFVIDIQCLVDQVVYILYGFVCVLLVLLVGNYVELGIEMGLYMLIDLVNVINVFVIQYDFWVDYCDDLDVKFQVWLV